MCRKGVTQSDLSFATGIAQPTLSGYINGKHEPGLYAIDKIAKALGCSVDEFRYI
jgi:transcriptional regulator with XRE-family HTH domain